MPLLALRKKIASAGVRFLQCMFQGACIIFRSSQRRSGKPCAFAELSQDVLLFLQMGLLPQSISLRNLFDVRQRVLVLY